jgi:8-oxo-dGTP pyrophosphatase MutT (NUDIX family)
LENDKWEFLLQTETSWGVILTHFVWWWIDYWDTELETVSKELIEETGYTDFEIIWPINMTYSRSLAYRFTKGKNQDVVWRCFYIKLKWNNKIKSEVDDWKHTIEWIKKEKISDKISWPTHSYLWDIFSNWEKPFFEEWTLVNSWKFDRLKSEEAEIEIKKFGIEKNILQ